MKSSTALSVYLDVSHLNLVFRIYELIQGYLVSNLNVYNLKQYNTVVKSKSCTARPPGLNPISSYPLLAILILGKLFSFFLVYCI